LARLNRTLSKARDVIRETRKKMKSVNSTLQESSKASTPSFTLRNSAATCLVLNQLPSMRRMMLRTNIMKNPVIRRKDVARKQGKFFLTKRLG